MPIVSGWVELPEGMVSAHCATAFIRVEDVSRADGWARAVAEQVLLEISPHQIERGILPFAVHVDDADVGRELALRVHLDLDNDFTVSEGDYVSTEHIPVFSNESRTAIRVRVRQVGSS